MVSRPLLLGGRALGELMSFVKNVRSWAGPFMGPDAMRAVTAAASECFFVEVTLADGKVVFGEISGPNASKSAQSDG